MIRQTGGRAVGATSTRSRPASRAIFRASAVETEPSFSSLSLIRKMGEILICSLWRKFVEMATISGISYYLPGVDLCHPTVISTGRTPVRDTGTVCFIGKSARGVQSQLSSPIKDPPAPHHAKLTSPVDLSCPSLPPFARLNSLILLANFSPSRARNFGPETGRPGCNRIRVATTSCCELP